MYCEICGRRVQSGLSLVRVGGTNLRACAECSRGRPRAQVQPSDRIISRSKTRETKRKSAPVITRKPQRPKDVPELSLRPTRGYGKAVQRAREGKGITVDEFSRSVGIRESLVRKIEAEKITPSISDLRKIERALGIKLIEEYSEEDEAHVTGEESAVTLGEATGFERLD